MHLGRAFERFWLSAETASYRSQGSIPISRLIRSNPIRSGKTTSSQVRAPILKISKSPFGAGGAPDRKYSVRRPVLEHESRVVSPRRKRQCHSPNRQWMRNSDSLLRGIMAP